MYVNVKWCFSFHSKVWEYFLEVCNDHDSFFGMTWHHLKSLLNNVEMTKTYILNPLAPEFIPKSIYPHGQPVFMSPGHPQSAAPGPYHPGARSTGAGHPYQQVVKCSKISNTGLAQALKVLVYTGLS